MVSDGQLSVAVQKLFGQSAPSSRPSVLFLQLLEVDVLLLLVARKDVVYSQGGIFEVVLKPLCRDILQGKEEKGKEGRDCLCVSFHHLLVSNWGRRYGKK